MCYYEFIEKYKVQNLPPNPDTILRFQRNHPGYDMRGVKQQDSHDVPMIYMPPFSDLYGLERNIEPSDVNEKVIEDRNLYALRALILFFPFRKMYDLHENGTLTYWEKFWKAKDTNTLYSKVISIFQNIQDRHNLKRIVKGDDNIESKECILRALGTLPKILVLMRVILITE